jgi:aryl-alcohol dehydrogenase-like predicted oxidoreductase
MLYTTLGKTCRQVSRIGFGGVPVGVKDYVQYYDPSNPGEYDQGLCSVRRAYELGINYFDTAPGYGDGMSERIIGEGLASVPSEQLFLATKIRPHEYTDVRTSLENSLKRLGRSYVDLIQIHGDHYSRELTDELLSKDGMLSQMIHAKNEGLVRFIGFTGECQNPEFYRLIETDCFDVVQVQYNLLFQHPYDPFFHSGSLYTCQEKGMGIVTMRSLTSGLFQKWIQMVNPRNTFDYTDALIQFVLSNPLVDVALLGMRSAQQVEHNVSVCMKTSSRIDLEKLHRRKVY